MSAVSGSRASERTKRDHQQMREFSQLPEGRKVMSLFVDRPSWPWPWPCSVGPSPPGPKPRARRLGRGGGGTERLTDRPPSSPVHLPSRGGPEPMWLSLGHGAETWSIHRGPSGRRELASSRGSSCPHRPPSRRRPPPGSSPQAGLSSRTLPTSTRLPQNLPQPPQPPAHRGDPAQGQTCRPSGAQPSQTPRGGNTPGPPPYGGTSAPLGPLAVHCQVHSGPAAGNREEVGAALALETDTRTTGEH